MSYQLAEMNTRAYQDTENFPNQSPSLREQFADFAAAFAAKEVAAVRVSIKFVGDYSAEELVAHIDSLKQRAEKAESALVRAVEEERMDCAKIACSYCRQDSAETRQYEEKPVLKNGYLIHERKGWTNSGMSCGAAAIHERFQVKGEGL